MSLAEQVQTWVPCDTFGLRLIAIRREKGLTQEEAAALCNINPKTWATWELPATPDKPPAKPRDMATTCADIEKGTGAERDWLMWGDRLPRSRCLSPSAQVSVVPPMMGELHLFDPDAEAPEPFRPVLVDA